MPNFYRFEHLSREAECIHAVTMRSANAPYGLSLALHTGEPAEQIITNRQKIAKDIDMRGVMRFVLADQTHSDHIHVVEDRCNRGWEEAQSAIADTDALVTNQKGVMLGILTADCVPVLLYDPGQGVVAAVHAGWRGTHLQIVSKCVERMVALFGCEPSDILAGIGPSIGACCYEVGEEVAEHFMMVKGGYSQDGEKYRLNLPYINKYQLVESDLKEANIEMSGICTACDTEHFFSYRKEQGCSGRFMSLIGMR